MADTAAFDLVGPQLEIKVTRNGKTLPIASVPNLQADDRLWIHPTFPDEQSVRYQLVVAFLRGSTNPPPENWFFRIEAWDKHVREEGVVITVPQDAQQALLFLAPQTSGGFGVLRGAVRAKPGAFVRASQDLNRASLDRTRLDFYLSAVKQTSDVNPEKLQARSTLLARSLNMKVDQQCFDKPSEQQAPCLTQNTDQLVLDDDHSQSMVAALTSGPNSDLIGQISTTKLAGGGTYSPYVGSIVDMVRVMESFHSPQYQYIPALSVPKGEQVNLRLNNPPSFRKPQSVLVVGLPPIEAAQLPPLRAVDPNEVLCLRKPSLVLPAEGAPLVFSTSMARNLVLHVEDKSGHKVDLPLNADAAQGGFLVNAKTLAAANLDIEVTGSLHGSWGFQSFTGPTYHLFSSRPSKWEVPASESASLIVGREDTLHLKSPAASCVEEVSFEDQRGKSAKAVWKLIKPDELEVKLPLQDVPPGPMKISMKQYGLTSDDELSLRAYSEVGHLDHFAFNAGDKQGELRGTRLDEVASLDMQGLHFTPATLSRVDQKDDLQLVTADAAAAAALQPNQNLTAKVELKDGRVLALQTTVQAPRPKVTLVSKNIELAGDNSAARMRLTNTDDLPLNGRLSFLLKAEVPAAFPRDEKIEVAGPDDSFHTSLSVTDGSLVMQDSQTVLASLDPMKAFGASAFGALRFRPVSANGVAGEWQPLANLVRVPGFKDVRCPDTPDRQCTLSGTNLFLLDSVASNADFTRNVAVPAGSSGPTLSVPRPNGTLLYFKLRDDADSVNSVALPVLPE